MFKFLARPTVSKPQNEPIEIERPASMFQLPTLPSIPVIPHNDKIGNIAERIDRNMFSSILTRKKPLEIVLNEDKENCCLQENPFKVYDESKHPSDCRIRDFQKDDGYFYFMSKLNPDHPRIKYLFCITIYSEGCSELYDTLKALYLNLEHFKQSGIEEKQISVLVVFDGILPIAKDIRKNIIYKLEKENGLMESECLEARQRAYEEDL
jgi:hypothetical protein